jgi:hypothetical protein
MKAAASMSNAVNTENFYGRGQDAWSLLAEEGERFLIERARLSRLTSYTEMDATLRRRTGLPGFDFSYAAERAAMGHLLYLIVERNRPVTSLMISALVIYLGGNDAGTGFYGLAEDMGELPRRASEDAKLVFWIGQTKKLYAYYAGAAN